MKLSDGSLPFAASTDVTMERGHEPEGGVVKIKVIVHEAEEGGYWAEVPTIPGCATQGESMEELSANVREAIEGCLSLAADQRSV